MQQQPTLFMVLLGCRPKGRHTEQHDIFFGIGDLLADLKPAMQAFWPGVQLHIDAWRTVTNVDGHAVSIAPKQSATKKALQLFFLNLGGYKLHEFEEFHYKVLTVAKEKNEAIKAAKRSAFFKHVSLPGTGISHIDDKYGVDVDDIFAIKDILPTAQKLDFSIQINPVVNGLLAHDQLHLGYTKWSSL